MVLDISLGAGVPHLVSGLDTSFLLLCLFGLGVSCEVVERSQLGFCISFDFPFFLA